MRALKTILTLMVILAAGCPDPGPTVTLVPQVREGDVAQPVQIFTLHIDTQGGLSLQASLHKALVAWYSNHPDLEVLQIVPVDNTRHVVIVAKGPLVMVPVTVEKPAAEKE